MLKRIRDFFANSRKWWNEHEASWEPARTIGPDGVSPFQVECEKTIKASLSSHGLELKNGRVESLGGEPMIIAEVPELEAKIWIYKNQTDIKTSSDSLCLEELDSKTTEEHLQKVREFISSLFVQ